MTNKQMQTVLRQLEKRRDAIGKERDRLQLVIDEYETLLAPCKTAMEDINMAIQSLSEQA